MNTATDRPRVAFFYDLFANYNRPDLGMRAIEALEQRGCIVEVPKQRACGYPYIGYGDLDAARDVALENLKHLAPYAEAGYVIVTTEPTAAYCLKVSYPKLLQHHPHAQSVADASHEYFAYLNELDTQPSERLKDRRFGFHCSCHARPIGSGEGAQQWLRRQGATVEFIDTGTCCGMAGTFGLKHGPLGYDLANAVGAPLFNLFKDADVDTIVTESSVCAIHLREGTGVSVIHPLELLE